MEGKTIRKLEMRPKRSKNGCKVCKERKIKCDESRPRCRQCKLSRRWCPFLDEQVVATKGTKVPLKPPKKIPRLTDIVPIYKIHGLSRSRFANYNESYSYRVYMNDVAHTLYPLPSQSALWAQLIPQYAESEPYLRDIIVACGAFRQSLKDAGFHNKQTLLRNSGAKSPIYIFAMNYYGKALRGMQEAIKTGRTDLNIALVACILVILCEGSMENLRSVAAHAHSAIRLFDTAMSNIPAPDSLICFRSHNSSKPLVNEYIIDAFENHTDILQSLFLDLRSTRSREAHLRIHQKSVSLLVKMPHNFISYNESRQYARLVARRTYHYINARCAVSASAIDKFGKAEMDDSIEVAMASPNRWGEEDLEEMQRCRDDILRWIATAALLVERNPPSTTEEVAMSQLSQMYMKYTLIDIAALKFTSQMEYDDHAAAFRELMRLATDIWLRFTQAINGVVPDRFEADLIPVLTFIGIRCREPEIRNRAIDLLGSVDYREGAWGTLQCSAIVGWIRDIEARGIDEDGFIPEEHRWTFTSISANPIESTADVVIQQNRGSEIYYLKKTVTW